MQLRSRIDATRLAVANLDRQGFDNFFSSFTPGYGFVAFDAAVDTWEPINNTYGVLHLLPIGHERPLAIPEDFVMRLKQAEYEYPAPAVEAAPTFARDERVYIASGPFAGHVGRYERIRNRGLAEVSVVLFGCQIKALVPLHQLVKEDAAIAA